MIKTQVIKEGGKPVAVVLDYKEFLRLKEMDMEDRKDYNSAIKVKRKNQSWTTHKDLKEALGIR